MRARSAVLAAAAVLFGAVAGSMLNPRPTGAVSKEIIQLQEDVSQLLQGQQAMRSTIDANNASLRTLLQQSLDSVNALNQQMALLQKNVQEATANSSSKIDTMSTQTQGLSDNLQDVQARVGKVAAQINDMQSTLQSIDGRLAGGSAPSGAPAGGAPSGAASRRPLLAAGSFRRHALSKRPAGFHHREIRSGAAGIRRLRAALPFHRPRLQRAVLSGRNFLRASGLQGRHRAVQSGPGELSPELQARCGDVEERLRRTRTGHEGHRHKGIARSDPPLPWRG